MFEVTFEREQDRVREREKWIHFGEKECRV